jgi:hypothetical protein
MTMSNFIRRTVIAIGVAGLLLVPAIAQAEWKVLGTRQVDRKAETDEITVTASRGGFKAIKLAVKGAAVEFKDVHVIYGNGEPDKLEVRNKIPEGGETRPLDLQGRERVIRKIVFWYKTEGVGRQRAVVTAWGLD